MELQLQVYLDASVKGLAIKGKKKNFAVLLLGVFNRKRNALLLV